MMKLTPRSALAGTAIALAMAWGILTPEGTRAAGSPGPYVLTDLGTLGGLSAQAHDIADYVAASGSLTFTVGQTSKTISVAVKGDKQREPYETFYVQLSGAASAFLVDAQGRGEIRNDDR